MECDDTQLVDKSKRGDVEAFGMLIKRHERGIYNLAYRMLKNVEDAKDAAQEIFLKVFASLNGFRGESGFATWLYRIATNECINRLKRPRFLSLEELRREYENEKLVEPPQLIDASALPEELAERSEIQQMVHKAMDALPDHYRLVITLRHLQGLSYKEIAEILDLPVGTVKTYLFRAKKTLKTKLQRFVE
ncbi:MAG: RNA polymerase sigma factor [Candidatus Poribacteria bacterium]